MNIIEKVQSGISNPEWDLYTKARYLYLKSCEYFTYDYRYYYSDISLTRELFNKKIDLENVTDNKVICGCWANQIYLPLLKLIGIDGKLMGTETGHQYIIFSINDMQIKADACGISDLARVKFDNSTAGFYPNYKYYDYEVIPNMDRKIGYLKDEYFRTAFDRRMKALEEEFQNTMNPSSTTYDDEYLMFKTYTIKELLEEYPKLKEFSDCQFFINYLSEKMFNDYDKSKITKYDLYNPNLPDWNFSRLFQFNLSNGILYFILTNIGSEYNFYEITERDASCYKTINHLKKIK